jgi:hypothetical protein
MANQNILSNLSPRTARDENIIFEELGNLCRQPGYAHAIAFFCWRDNTIKLSGEHLQPDDLCRQYSFEHLLTTELSTLIGLWAKGAMDLKSPSPDVLHHYVHHSEYLLHELHMSMQKPWLPGFDSMIAGSPQEIDPFSTAAGLREPIFYGGESAYDFQYLDLAPRKYNGDRAWLKAHKGFSIDEATAVARSISNLLLGRLEALAQASQSSERDAPYLSAYIFNINELRGVSNLPDETIEHIVRAFSIDRTSQNASFESLTSFNGVNAAPIIPLADGAYLLFQSYSLLEALYDAPFFWMAADTQYEPTAAYNRGKFTEEFLYERLVSVFGAERVFINVDIYDVKRRITEADVLVVYGSRALVVQAKSKRLTIESRKGNDLQLKDDFKKAIQSAYDQAVLCGSAIASGGYRFLLQRDGTDISSRLTSVQEIFPICAVSDHYPALSMQARQFLKLKTTTAIRPPVVSDVFFIDVATEILSSPLQFLNYLALRARFSDKLLVNQEFAILGYHLSHNLWLEENLSIANLGDDFSAPLDIAMIARRRGVPGPRTPPGILTRFDGSPIGSLLADIEAAATPELVGLGMTLLQISSDTAKHINSGIARLVAEAAKDGKHHDFSVLGAPESSGLTIHVNWADEATARESIGTHCKLRKYDAKADKWYGVLLSPGTGTIRGAMVFEGKWQPDGAMEKAMKSWRRAPMTPIATLSSGRLRRKVGRNDPCPCGSGLKYKKCHLGL